MQCGGQAVESSVSESGVDGNSPFRLDALALNWWFSYVHDRNGEMTEMRETSFGVTLGDFDVGVDGCTASYV